MHKPLATMNHTALFTLDQVNDMSAEEIRNLDETWQDKTVTLAWTVPAWVQAMFYDVELDAVRDNEFVIVRYGFQGWEQMTEWDKYKWLRRQMPDCEDVILALANGGAA